MNTDKKFGVFVWLVGFKVNFKYGIYIICWGFFPQETRAGFITAVPEHLTGEQQ